MSNHRLSESSKSFVNDISTVHISTKVSEALLDVKWAAAMKEEMTALQKYKTWELVSLPEVKKIFGCRWVFAIKQIRMVRSISAKQDLQLEGLLRRMVLIMKQPSLLW